MKQKKKPGRQVREKRSEWTPRKISFAVRYSGNYGGNTHVRMSLPAISMHIAACREARKAILIHDDQVA